ncbi:hypothetical protein [Phnomibacter ginsenosidimutans]|uniref:Uncharacterized protein n=1 Tax=Phnomibacter ginsenosidimutans TaxID=2676868 RepID=A0A6I6H5A5_9BACT|nr:hypothetical protein [Phnomibacter ginsenosidimutans]QGW29541.1 hypothetical protein GLV81_16755 [Phnomibacter ginsenosidimutans]
MKKTVSTIFKSLLFLPSIILLAPAVISSYLIVKDFLSVVIDDKDNFYYETWFGLIKDESSMPLFAGLSGIAGVMLLKFNFEYIKKLGENKQ